MFVILLNLPQSLIIFVFFGILLYLWCFSAFVNCYSELSPEFKISFVRIKVTLFYSPVYRESGVIEDDSISGDFDNFPEGKVRLVKIQEEMQTGKTAFAFHLATGFPRLQPATCFRAFTMGCTSRFSRAYDQLLDFPRKRPVACSSPFPAS